MTGEGNEILVKAFKGADLRNNTDVRMELDSGISSTRAGQNQFIMQLLKEGFFGDITQMPKVQHELMKRFGISWVPNETSIHEDRAGRENSMAALATDNEIEIEFEDSDNPVALLKGLFFARDNEGTQEVDVLIHDPYFKFDNDQVHYDSHIRVVLSPEFKEWPIPNQMVLIGHADMNYFQLEAAKQQEMMDQMQLAQLKGGAPPEQPGGPLGLPGTPPGPQQLPPPPPGGEALPTG